VGSEQDLLTFRTTPEPIRLAGEFYLAIRDFGQIINESFKYFVELPDKFLSRQEKELCTVLPPLFRIDFVLPADGTLPMVMEIQVDDSVPGLMAVETAIYTGKRPSEITAPLFIEQIGLGQVPTAIIWVYDIKDGKIVPSLQRFIDQVAEASSGYISCTIVRSDQLSQLRTEGFDYLWNYSYLPAEEVEAFVREKGLKQIAPSPLSIFSSKRMFSLFTQPELSNFWIERLGIDSFKLLTAMLPHTTDISDVGKLRKIVNKGKYVIKTGAQIPGLIDGAKGVFGPWDDYDRLEEVLEEFGFDSLLLQAQEYVRPKQLKVLVRNTRPKLGLLPYSGPNRICATVVGGNVTAVEATISKKEPAKGYQDCVYTAVLPEI